MPTPTLDIVIVNWNTGLQLRECIDSIVSTNKNNVLIERVVIVDNASTDGSTQGLEEVQLPLTLIRNEKNYGFAAACNQGAAASMADYLLFLNPDTRLFANSLDAPVLLMEAPDKQSIGICGIQLIDEFGEVSPSCSYFPRTLHFLGKMIGASRLLPGLFPLHTMDDWDHAKSVEVDQVMGAFFLIRRSVFAEMNGFDERFFVYFEEVDLSYRARRAGWRSFYLSEAQAFHRGCGSSDKVKAARLFYSLRSRILYGRKHFGVLSATSLTIGTLTIEFIARISRCILRRDFSAAAETFEGYRQLWWNAPSFLAMKYNRIDNVR